MTARALTLSPSTFDRDYGSIDDRTRCCGGHIVRFGYVIPATAESPEALAY